MGDVTQFFGTMEQGNARAVDEILPIVYEGLRRMARDKMAGEKPGHTLQPTALVHEAWLRMGQDQRFENRAHFFGAAAEAMRRILVDSARRKSSVKNGGKFERVDLDAVEVPLPVPDNELLAIDEALNSLSAVDTRAADMVKLCFFVGLTQEEAAKALDISLSTAERVWKFARAWLFREMERARRCP